MRKKYLNLLSIGITAATLVYSPAHAKKIYPAELVGRDLDTPIGKGFGHVGITNFPMNDPSGMSHVAYLVIEVLNETPVGQINTMGDFISRTKFWGSKWGVADQGMRGYKVLVEANHQRWWCPKYTLDTKYHIGSGIPDKAIPIECGTWRCDTYVWWAFFSQGWNVMPGSIWLPVELFKFFPYYNFKVIDHKSNTAIINKTLENISAEELNELPIEEFQMIMDTPPANYVTSPSTIQLQFANNPNLNDAKRSIMIDRLIADDAEVDLVTKLLKLYNETDNIEVKNTVIQDLMLYNQRHVNVASYVKNDQMILKAFFDDLLDVKSLTPRMKDDGLRGYIDIHSPEEIMANLDKIDKLFSTINPYSSIMLKYTLTFKSNELQHIYIKSIVNELRKENNSDLDSYFFGPLTIRYKNNSRNPIDLESKKVIVEYLKEVHYKYTSHGIKASPGDFHRTTTAPYYFELVKDIGM